MWDAPDSLNNTAGLYIARFSQGHPTCSPSSIPLLLLHVYQRTRCRGPGTDRRPWVGVKGALGIEPAPLLQALNLWEKSSLSACWKNNSPDMHGRAVCRIYSWEMWPLNMEVFVCNVVNVCLFIDFEGRKQGHSGSNSCGESEYSPPNVDKNVEMAE